MKNNYKKLEWNIPIWVMEPVRGGKLAKLSETQEQKLKAIRPDESIPSWAFRFLQTFPEVTMVLSGMSNMEQMQDVCPQQLKISDAMKNFSKLLS